MDNTALGVLRLPRLLRMHAYFAHVHALKLHSSLDASFVTYAESIDRSTGRTA